MAKFGINDILNAKTKAAGQQAQTEGYKEIYLSPYEVKAAQENTHQKLEGIEELADSFLHVGQEQPTVLARVGGEYRIIDGHRRNAANILNLERGHKEYEKVLYRFMDMSEAMYELRLLAGNGYTQELTAYEKTRLVERTKAALIRAKEEDGLEIQGKMRDLVAAMINESSTNVARMDAINNNATPEIKEQLKEGKGNSRKSSGEKGGGRLRNTAPRKHNVFVLFLPEIQRLQRKNGNVPEMRPVHK